MYITLIESKKEPVKRRNRQKELAEILFKLLFLKSCICKYFIIKEAKTHRL
jgi:hypothetical protein